MCYEKIVYIISPTVVHLIMIATLALGGAVALSRGVRISWLY